MPRIDEANENGFDKTLDSKKPQPPKDPYSPRRLSADKKAEQNTYAENVHKMEENIRKSFK